MLDQLTQRFAGSGAVKLGLVVSLRAVFEEGQAIQMAGNLRRVLADHPTIQLVDPARNLRGTYADGVIRPEDPFQPMAAQFLSEGVDGLLIVPGNYGDEVNSSRIARAVHGALNVPVFTYAPWDGPPREDGTRSTDRGCGIYPMRQMLRRGWIEPGYIPMSDVGDAVFGQGLMNMLQAMASVRAVRNKKILRVGGDQPTFPGIETPYLWINSLWGVENISAELLTLVDRIRARIDAPLDWLPEAMLRLFAGVNTDTSQTFNDQALRKIVLLAYGLAELACEHDADLMTVRCWPELQQVLGVMACYSLGFLTELGLTTSCETDGLGLLSMALLRGAAIGSGAVPMFLDNTITVPADDGTVKVLKWHCGRNGCSNCRSGCEMVLADGWILPDPATGITLGQSLELGETVTIARITTDRAGRLLTVAYEAEVVDGPSTLGTHFYVQPREWPEFEQELMDYPVVHHWAAIRGAYAHAVKESARWLEMSTALINKTGDVVRGRLLCTDARGMLSG